MSPEATPTAVLSAQPLPILLTPPVSGHCLCGGEWPTACQMCPPVEKAVTPHLTVHEGEPSANPSGTPSAQ
jgi:hypothetical protein